MLYILNKHIHIVETIESLFYFYRITGNKSYQVIYHKHYSNSNWTWFL